MAGKGRCFTLLHLDAHRRAGNTCMQAESDITWQCARGWAEYGGSKGHCATLGQRPAETAQTYNGGDLLDVLVAQRWWWSLTCGRAEKARKTARCRTCDFICLFVFIFISRIFVARRYLATEHGFCTTFSVMTPVHKLAAQILYCMYWFYWHVSSGVDVKINE